MSIGAVEFKGTTDSMFVLDPTDGSLIEFNCLAHQHIWQRVGNFEKLKKCVEVHNKDQDDNEQYKDEL